MNTMTSMQLTTQGSKTFDVNTSLTKLGASTNVPESQKKQH